MTRKNCWWFGAISWIVSRLTSLELSVIGDVLASDCWPIAINRSVHQQRVPRTRVGRTPALLNLKAYDLLKETRL